MLFDKNVIATKHYSILLKNLDTTIIICAEEMTKSINKEYYEFFINDNLISIIPVEMVVNIV